MPVRTAASLFARVRAIADMQDDDSANGFLSDTVLLTWLNQARYQLDLIFARASYVIGVSRTTIPATGASAYNLPTPIAIVSVDWVSTDGQRLLRIPPKHAAQNYPVLPGRPATSDSPQSYYAELIADGTLDLYLDPRPTGGQFLVTTIPYHADLTATTDTVNYPGGADEWLVLEMARNAIIKEEGDTRAIEKKQKEIANHIEAEGWSRQFLDVPNWRNPREESTNLPSYPWLIL